MTTYKDSAYSEKQVNEAVRAAGHRSFIQCMAHLTTQGKTLTQIAEELGLIPQKFWAYYQQWCRVHIKPLTLDEE